ncbi:MAG: hypothetical protein KAT43_06730 [Nanoarchaeota archaeon]|nr:hypothetical protein [Nanoarchaeota archaeon]
MIIKAKTSKEAKKIRDGNLKEKLRFNERLLWLQKIGKVLKLDKNKYRGIICFQNGYTYLEQGEITEYSNGSISSDFKRIRLHNAFSLLFYWFLLEVRKFIEIKFDIFMWKMKK